MNNELPSESPSVKDIPRKPPKFDGQYISPDSPVYFLVILDSYFMGKLLFTVNFGYFWRNLNSGIYFP